MTTQTQPDPGREAMSDTEPADREGVVNDDTDSNLVKYARSELELAGLFDKDSDYDGMLGTAALDIVRVFASQGHSGMSAAIITELVGKLMRFEPLTPLTYEPDEWIDHGEASGRPMWQNKRDSKVFSEDGGKTHYRLGDETP